MLRTWIITFLLCMIYLLPQGRADTSYSASGVEVQIPPLEDSRSTGGRETQVSSPGQGIAQSKGVAQSIPLTGRASAKEAAPSTVTDTPLISESGIEPVKPATLQPGPNATEAAEKQTTQSVPQLIRGGPTRPLKPHRSPGPM
jgi:hypothetical protein